MLIIKCPWCGERDHVEFTYGGDAGVTRPDPSSDGHEWLQYVYMRNNPRGPHREYWQHTAGCRQWIEVLRNTLTHEITGVVAPEGGTGGNEDEI